jgi:hypothetical protein
MDVVIPGESDGKQRAHAATGISEAPGPEWKPPHTATPNEQKAKRLFIPRKKNLFFPPPQKKRTRRARRGGLSTTDK